MKRKVGVDLDGTLVSERSRSGKPIFDPPVKRFWVITNRAESHEDRLDASKWLTHYFGARVLGLYMNKGPRDSYGEIARYKARILDHYDFTDYFENSYRIYVLLRKMVPHVQIHYVKGGKEVK